MIKKSLLIFVCVLLLLSSVVVAGRSGNAGVTPDSPLWAFDSLIDDLSLALSVTELGRVNKALEIADERLLEIEEMLEKNNFKKAEKASLSHKKIITQIEKYISASKESESAYILQSTVETKLQLHKEKIQQIEEELLKTEHLGNTQKEEIIALFEQVTARVVIANEKVQTKQKQTKIKLQEKLSYDEIAVLDEDRYEHLAVVAQSQAKRAIDLAQNKIDDFEITGNSITGNVINTNTDWVDDVNFCFNGAQDSNEDGVDCGGVCEAECGPSCMRSDGGDIDSFEKGYVVVDFINPDGTFSEFVVNDSCDYTYKTQVSKYICEPSPNSILVDCEFGCEDGVCLREPKRGFSVYPTLGLSCVLDADCLNGYYCNGDSICELECSVNVHCDPTEVCSGRQYNLGVCYNNNIFVDPDCFFDGDCADGNYCDVDYECVQKTYVVGDGVCSLDLGETKYNSYDDCSVFLGTTCIDTEDGQDPFVKGDAITSYLYSGFTNVATGTNDHCAGGDLIEYYCAQGMRNEFPNDWEKNFYSVDCEFGCSDGACLNETIVGEYCNDSDGGVNYYEKGTIKGSPLTTGADPVDYCVSYSENGNTLVEYSCTGNVGKTSESYPCPNGCSDGACLNETNSIDTTPPIVEVHLETVWNGVEATVTCFDSGIGCASHFNYLLADESTFDSSSFIQHSYSDTILIQESTTLHIQAQDVLGNHISELHVVVNVKITCFNGVEDPDEEGVDCGGVCAVDCESNSEVCNINFKQLTLGLSFGCAITDEHKLACWGDYMNGGGKLSPVYLHPEFSFSQISAGVFHMCGVLTDGRAMCWGQDTDGTLGNGPSGTQRSPVYVDTDWKFKQVSAGYRHSCGLLKNGSVACWGSDWQEKLGNGLGEKSSDVPVLIASNDLFVDVSAGQSHTCAITTKGKVACWGNNPYGQVGIKTAKTYQPIPIYIDFDTTFKQITSGHEFSCGITESGKAVCWGWDLYGQVGNGGPVYDSNNYPISRVYVPEFVDLNDAAIHITAGTHHACAITSKQDTYCWGKGIYGVLGNNDDSDTRQHTPVLVQGNNKFIEIKANSFQTCARLEDNSIKCWGRDLYGQLGNGIDAGNNKAIPVSVDVSLLQADCEIDKIPYTECIEPEYNDVYVQGTTYKYVYDVNGENISSETRIGNDRCYSISDPDSKYLSEFYCSGDSPNHEIKQHKFYCENGCLNGACIQEETSSCFNGVQEPAEDGIDCGGVCKIPCNDPDDYNIPLDELIWTPWLNRDLPSGRGDWETTREFQKSGQLKCQPLAVECVTLDGASWEDSDDSEYLCSLKNGGVCRNEYQAGTVDNYCEDYKVRFACKSDYAEIDDSCFNGVQDPAEDGVDCGGVCVAQCDTCSNQVQDLYELGVDCGGICPVTCDEEDTSIVYCDASKFSHTQNGIELAKAFLSDAKKTYQTALDEFENENYKASYYFAKCAKDLANAAIRGNLYQNNGNARGESSLSDDVIEDDTSRYGSGSSRGRLALITRFPSPIFNVASAIIKGDTNSVRIELLNNKGVPITLPLRGILIPEGRTRCTLDSLSATYHGFPVIATETVIARGERFFLTFDCVDLSSRPSLESEFKATMSFEYFAKELNVSRNHTGHVEGLYD